jgi:hypothetical protein
MKLHPYLRVLRPVRTLVLSVVYILIVWSWLKTFFRVPAPVDRFLAIALVGSALHGSLLIGPLQEVMHRSFAAFLPGLHRRLALWHAWGVGVSAVIFTVVLAFVSREVPLPASLGLVLAGLSLPALNQRRRIRGAFRLWHPGMMALGGLIAAFAPMAVHRACTDAPWVVLALSAPIVYSSFRYGFDRRLTRRRALEPVFCIQTTILFNQRLISEARSQMLALTQKQAKGGGGRDWTVKSVGDSTWAWLGVQFHVLFGRSTAFYQLIAVQALVYPLLALLFPYLMEKATHPGAATLAGVLRQFLENPPVSGNPMGSFASIGPVLMLSGLTMFYAVLVASAVPHRKFPISRERMARVQFAYAILVVAANFAIAILGASVLVLGACVFTGLPPGPGPLTRMLAVFMVLMAATPLIMSIGLFKRALWRILVSILLAIPTVPLCIYAATSGAAFAVSPLGFIAFLPVWILSAWCGWRAFHRHYRKADLGTQTSILLVAAQSGCGN